MNRSRWILPPRRIRVVLYVLVVAVLFLFRGPESFEGIREVLMPPEPGRLLRVAGRDPAPALLDTLLRAYQRDYPSVRVETSAAGGTYALDALLGGRADVAVLARALRTEEISAFAATDGDAPVVEPVAVGALVFLASADSPVDSIAPASLRILLGDATGDELQRLYVEEPNRGSWHALLTALDVDHTSAEHSENVVFLEDVAAVEQALRHDPRGLGVRAVFAFPVEPPPALKVLTLAAPAQERAVRPTYEDVGYGRYPLTTRLNVVCRASARGEAAKLVTFAAGARGQRRLERAGFLPARRFLREILLDRAPVGAR